MPETNHLCPDDTLAQLADLAARGKRFADPK